MRVREIGLLLILFKIVGNISFAQDLESFSCEWITEEDGLISNEVFHMITDDRGFLWFATNNGISRYNGKTFKNYTIEDGLPDNLVLRFYRQRNGSIVGECINSLYFKIYNDSIFPHPINDVTKNVIPSFYFSCSYFQDESGEIKLGTRHGLFSFSSSNQLMHVDTNCLEGNKIQISYQVHENGVFVARNNGCAKSAKSIEFLNLLDSSACSIGVAPGRLYSYYATHIGHDSIVFHSANHIYLMVANEIEAVIYFKDEIVGVFSDSNFLTVTTRNGIYSAYMESNKKIVFKHSFKGYTFTSAHCEKDGNLWLTTTSKGVLKINIGGEQVIRGKYPNHNVRTFLNVGTNLYTAYENGQVFYNDKLVVSEINDRNYANDLVSINNRVVTLGAEEGVFVDGVMKKQNEIEKFLRKSTSCFKYSPNIIFHTTVIGLEKISIDNDSIENEEILDGHDRISAAYLHNGTIFIATTKQVFVYEIEDNSFIDTMKLDKSIVDFVEIDNNVFGLYSNGIMSCFSDTSIPDLKTPKLEGIFKYYKAIHYEKTIIMSTNLGIFHWGYDPLSGNPILDDFSSIAHVKNLKLQEDTLVFSTSEKVYRKPLHSRFELSHAELHSLKLNNKQSTGKKEIPFNENTALFSWECISSSEPVTNYRFLLMGHEEHFQYTTSSKISYSSLQPGDYEFEIAATVDGFNYGESKSYSFTVTSPYWMRWWFYALVGLVIFILSVSIYRVKLKRVKRKFELQNLISELKSKALFGQLNPHLVFNVLNSIQGLVSKGDIERSNIYIAQFSSFMRLSLKYSKVLEISIEEELDITKQYIELEKLRFLDQIEFKISNKDDASGFMVPPLILQPLIENSIKHGIRPTKGRKGSVEIFVKEFSDYYLLEVRDNGVGFPQLPKFGDGLEITRKRLLSHNSKNEMSIGLEDGRSVVQLKISPDPR